MFLQALSCYGRYAYDYTRNTITPFFFAGLLFLALYFGNSPWEFIILGLVLIIFYSIFECSLSSSTPTRDTTSLAVQDDVPIYYKQFKNNTSNHSHKESKITSLSNLPAKTQPVNRFYTQEILRSVYYFTNSFLLSACAQLIALRITGDKEPVESSLNIYLVGAAGIALCIARRYLPSSIEQHLNLCSFLSCALGVVCWSASAEHKNTSTASPTHATENLLNKLACIAYVLFMNRESLAIDRNSVITRLGCVYSCAYRIIVLGFCGIFTPWIHQSCTINLALLISNGNHTVGALFARLFWTCGLIGLASSFTTVLYKDFKANNLLIWEKLLISLSTAIPPLAGALTGFLGDASIILSLINGTVTFLGVFIIPTLTQLLPLHTAYSNRWPKTKLYLPMGLHVIYACVTTGVIILTFLGSTVHFPSAGAAAEYRMIGINTDREYRMPTSTTDLIGNRELANEFPKASPMQL